MQPLAIQNKIYVFRGKNVMIDLDLAGLYEVEIKVLNQAVWRNSSRFPADFMFRLTSDEWSLMPSQIVTASQSKRNIHATPFALTGQGLAMLSGILKSQKAIEVNITIMHAFVQLRHSAHSHTELTEKLRQMEKETIKS